MNANSLISLGGFGVVILILLVVFARQFGLISKLFIESFVKNPLFGIIFWVNLAVLLLVSFWYPLFWPLTYLALFITMVKFYEWSDDRFLDDKIGGWMMSQKFVFVQIIPNGQSLSTVSDMEKFLTALSAVYGNRSQKDFRTTGKFYDEFIFEIHSDGGRLGMYCRMNKSSSLPVFMTAAQTHFPRVKFVEVEDPCKNWPRNWQEMNQKYEHLIGGELAFPKTDLYPTKNISDLEREKNNNLPLKDPFFVLTNSLEKIAPEDYVIIQFLCRPFDHAKFVGKKWADEASKLKKELANNAEVARGKGGLIQPYTLQEENLINSVEQKMVSVNFATKVRFGLFGAKVTSKRYLPGLMGYLKIFYTERQAIVPKFKTWEDSDNATWGPFWDKLYWTPEDEKRKREVYSALIGRSGGKGGDRSYWDASSLAAIFHVPNFSLDSIVLDGNNLLQSQMAISDVDFETKNKPQNPNTFENNGNNSTDYNSNEETQNVLTINTDSQNSQNSISNPISDNSNISNVSSAINSAVLLSKPKDFTNQVPTTQNLEILVNLPINSQNSQIPNSQNPNYQSNLNGQNPNFNPNNSVINQSNLQSQTFQNQTNGQNPQSNYAQSISKSNFQIWKPQSDPNTNNQNAQNPTQNGNLENQNLSKLTELELVQEKIKILKAKINQDNANNLNQNSQQTLQPNHFPQNPQNFEIPN